MIASVPQHITATTVADLFCILWRAAITWTSPQRVNATPMTDDCRRRVHAALAKDDEHETVQALTNVLPVQLNQSPDTRGITLDVMAEIDFCFYQIHPRARYSLKSGGRPPSLPEWLRDYRDTRREHGAYVVYEDDRLVCRGPLVQLMRDEHASSAEDFSDRFAALTLVPTVIKEKDRPINIVHAIISADASAGIGSGQRDLNETIAFIPVAVAPDDVVVESREGSRAFFGEYRVNQAIDPVARCVAGLQAASYADIAIAPELVMSETHADRLANVLGEHCGELPRLIVAGSGLTTQHTPEEAIWNESRMFNGAGAELWRQRKIWVAGASEIRRRDAGLELGPGGLMYEDNEESSDLVVVDSDTLGRCVVLICQDIMTTSLAAEVVSRFQPDWVFVPILDAKIRSRSWVIQRAFFLSGLSNARFVIANSLTIASRVERVVAEDTANAVNCVREPRNCGAAVGPLSPPGDERSRARAFAVLPEGSDVVHATIVWNSTNGWEQSTFS